MNQLLSIELNSKLFDKQNNKLDDKLKLEFISNFNLVSVSIFHNLIPIFPNFSPNFIKIRAEI